MTSGINLKKSIPPPGATGGPCFEPCLHPKCADLRGQANMLCGVCHNPIGFDSVFSDNLFPTHMACMSTTSSKPSEPPPAGGTVGPSSPIVDSLAQSAAAVEMMEAEIARLRNQVEEFRLLDASQQTQIRSAKHAAEANAREASALRWALERITDRPYGTVSIPTVVVEPGFPLPKRQTKGAAGFDLHARAGITIPSRDRRVIPVGIRTAIPEGWHVDIRPRSGLSSRGIHAVLGLIDSDYRGEWGVVLVNGTTEPYQVNIGDRIAQAVIAPDVAAQFVEAADLPPSKRGEKGWGSTGGTINAPTVGFSVQSGSMCPLGPNCKDCDSAAPPDPMDPKARPPMILDTHTTDAPTVKLETFRLPLTGHPPDCLGCQTCQLTVVRSGYDQSVDYGTGEYSQVVAYPDGDDSSRS